MQIEEIRDILAGPEGSNVDLVLLRVADGGNLQHRLVVSLERKRT
jgi:hypothetical protein